MAPCAERRGMRTHRWKKKKKSTKKKESEENHGTTNESSFQMQSNTIARMTKSSKSRDTESTRMSFCVLPAASG